MRYLKPVNWFLWSLSVAPLCFTSACATANPGQQVIVQLKAPVHDNADLVRLVRQTSGLQASFVSSSSPLIHAIRLECSNADQCEQGLQKLKKDPGFVSAEWDRLLQHSSPKRVP